MAQMLKSEITKLTPNLDFMMMQGVLNLRRPSELSKKTEDLHLKASNIKVSKHKNGINIFNSSCD